MSSVLQKYFPMIRTREAILQEITTTPGLYSAFQKWDKDQQDAFLAYCTGQKGLHILHDPVFKEILNPELSPGLLLRQYKRMRNEKSKSFSYKDIKKVYTIVLYEKSTSEFHQFPENYIHRFSQQSDTGISIDLLQEYVFIPLDIFYRILHNKGIRNQLEAWLTFLSTDEPEMIEKLILSYPQFRCYYEEIYTLCQNTERVMDMFSKELQELDKNTVQYMIDEMQEEIDAQKETIDKQELLLNEKEQSLITSQKTIKEQEEEIQKLKELLNELSSR